MCTLSPAGQSPADVVVTLKNRACDRFRRISRAHQPHTIPKRLESRSSPLMSSQPTPSKRKRANSSLTDRVPGSDDLHLIVDAMSAAVTRCSRDLRYLWVSRAYAEWLGLS